VDECKPLVIGIFLNQLSQAGGVLRTSTRPTLNVLLLVLVRAGIVCMSIHPDGTRRVMRTRTRPISVRCLLRATLLPGQATDHLRQRAADPQVLLRGRAVQVTPIKTVLKVPGAKQLKLKHDKLLAILLQFCFRNQLAPLQRGRRGQAADRDGAGAVDVQPGEAAQDEPIKPQLKVLGTKRKKPKCDEPLSTFAFKFDLRRYN